MDTDSRRVSLLDFVDKRGRKVKESASEDLSNFYELCDEDGMCTSAMIVLDMS